MTSPSRLRQSGNLPSLAGADWLTAPATQQILGILENAGFEARIVGGTIRNALLGRPVYDIDIATTALPDEVAAVAEEAGLHVIPTGLKHGTVTVVACGQPFEVTTLREDVATNGRHADVRFTTVWEADASRRDFTINAFYCDARGAIFDPLGGFEDIGEPRIRFIGDPDQRIAEDYLRILRFFRFFSEYAKGDPDHLGLSACVRGRSGLRQLSRERVRQEFLKLLAAPRAVAAIDAIYCHGLLSEFLPVAPRVQHFARLIGASPAASAILRLATLSLATDADSVRIAQALRLSNEEQAALQNIAAVVGSAPEPPGLCLARKQIYEFGSKNFQDRAMYLRSSAFGALTDPAWAEIIHLAGTWQPPIFPLTGKDILALGVKSGPMVGQILKQTQKAWIDRDFAMTHEELTSYAKNIIRSLKD